MTSQLEFQSKYYRNLTNLNRPPPPPPPPPPAGDQYFDNPMQRIREANTVNMSAELFEKMYMSRRDSFSKSDLLLPPPADWRKSVGNPTPIALVGIVVSLTPLSCDLMGLLGAGGNGAAGVASYYFFGGLLLIVSGLLEWVLGNTFPSVVFTAYGAFFFSFAGTLTPAFGAFAAYAPAGSDPSEGLKTQGFNASFGWFLVWMGVLSLVFFICSLRTNVVFVIIFASLIGVFGSLSGAYFLLAGSFTRNAVIAGTFVKVGGVCAFIASIAGWWIFLSIMLATLDFPWEIPVGDLSGWIQGKSQNGMV